MVLPQGGDFPRNVQSLFKVLQADQRICVHDNGTNVCGLGHKLKFPGTCFNQAIGTFNSTSPSFQPAFPICTTDYLSSGFHPALIFSSGAKEGDGVVVSKTAGASRTTPLYAISHLVVRQHPIYKTLLNLLGGIFVGAVPGSITGSTFYYTAETFAFSTYMLAQFNPGALPHLPGTYSDLYVYDVVGSYTYYNKLVIEFLTTLGAVLRQVAPIESFQHLIGTDRHTTISGEVDLCAGDETPPAITYLDPPASGTTLRPPNQIVHFTLSDPIGGINLSSLNVKLSSQTTGNINLILGGVDQTSGRILILGDPSSYQIRYLPSFTWQANDTVVTTISGMDMPPLLGGNPFFCGTPGVNTFIGDIRFKVRNVGDLGASITSLPDLSPPYIANFNPAADSTDNSVFTPVVIQVADALAGVRLGSLTVVVDGRVIVLDGVPNPETTIDGFPNLLTITYNKTQAFEYGSTVLVSVFAEDRAPTPNSSFTEYSFSCIDVGALRIENFIPPIGTSINLHDVDIEVDIVDDTYGVNPAESFLVVNGAIVSGTVTTITSGIHFQYHPPNDFAFNAPIVVKVHGANNNTEAMAVREDIYTLYYGNRILYHRGGKTYKHDQQVEVFVRARNIEQLRRDLTTRYFFTTYSQPYSDFGAYLEAINPSSNLGATISGVGPEHHYGKTMTVMIYVKDLDGHALGPYHFSYTIEQAP